MTNDDTTKRFSSHGTSRTKVSALAQRASRIFGSFFVGLAYSLEVLVSFFFGLAAPTSFLYGDARNPNGNANFFIEAEVLYLFHLLELALVKRLPVPRCSLLGAGQTLDELPFAIVELPFQVAFLLPHFLEEVMQSLIVVFELHAFLFVLVLVTRGQVGEKRWLRLRSLPRGARLLFSPACLSADISLRRIACGQTNAPRHRNRSSR